MGFEQEVRTLCDRVVACESDEEAVQLTRHMQELLHATIDELRQNARNLPLARCAGAE